MKITGGQIKGRRLAAPKNLEIRPSSNKVREAIFNIIGQNLSGSRVLDLFSGTGLLGMEALSRGADLAVFVDHGTQSLALIKKNLALCGYEQSGRICKWNLTKGLPKNRPFLDTTFDLVFLDPPYKSGPSAGLMEELSASERLEPGALIILESAKTVETRHALSLLETRIYGDTKLSFFKKGDYS
ncbi:MAG: 16S rRNA (guanine(966)-N(2))-methyltransferase RsmD [Desulfobacteraceae bacterium 4572_87]|nr:MAG: 16S rRNA (guanine(966)-N(2))-methyltransferase RsmD [Desulfobacteraceae bacterium 4572_87]